MKVLNMRIRIVSLQREWKIYFLKKNLVLKKENVYLRSLKNKYVRKKQKLLKMKKNEYFQDVYIFSPANNIITSVDRPVLRVL